MHSRIYIVIDKFSDYLDLNEDVINFQKPIDYVDKSNFEKDIEWLKTVYKDKLHLKKYIHPDIDEIMYEIDCKELLILAKEEAELSIKRAEEYIAEFKKNGNFDSLWLASHNLWPDTGFLFYFKGELNNLFDLTWLASDVNKLYIIKSFDYHS